MQRSPDLTPSQIAAVCALFREGIGCKGASDKLKLPIRRVRELLDTHLEALEAYAAGEEVRVGRKSARTREVISTTPRQTRSQDEWIGIRYITTPHDQPLAPQLNRDCPINRALMRPWRVSHA